MNRRLGSFIVPAVLAGLAVFLTARLIDEARLLGQAAAVETGVAEDRLAMALARDAIPPEPPPPPVSGMHEILQRPLFSPTRRPPVRVAAEAEPEAPKGADLPEFQLQGIVVIGDSTMALLAGAPDAPLLRVGAGDEIDGWHVLEIAADGVVLRRGDETYRIRLDYQKQSQ